MPTSPTYTFSNTGVDPVINPEDAMGSILPVRLKASTTFAAGTLIGPITASPGTYGPYAVGNSDGTQIPAGILRYAAVTDSSGNITGIDEWGNTGLEAPMFTEGDFNCAELTGLDSNAVTVLGGHLIGSISTGVFAF